MTKPVHTRSAAAMRSMADVVEDLATEFAPTLDTATVVRVVRLCSRELVIAGSFSTGLLHARAHSRLLDRAAIKKTQPAQRGGKGAKQKS